ncbi:inverse autotransporter beta domain-containing protein [Escherichia albertii]|uniref:inverse autotransporter beta domain-containing protein n=1 Tax=Escherichia albertii TaxID=208962 RepID=UPI002119DD12|nr:inverse autotransporter beta domain-containing protein [Escherichia albertii]MCQ8969950.1 inverse autotransporter beta domain-containing protein [Escherichia albertii]UUK78463.1 inverse autotransporter beta domain-containing protein [Escherichia albertii]UUK82922.1 inverse autotransporter beta domain-containing protein [Escherichia albertii]UUL01099.1 inverse autotransporter beta domain-containing protein [Escherichia albertii]UUL09986.1 inverse autotransporter beta domain-containing protei
MTRKGQESGNCRGDNTVCGFGARLRRLTAGICLITQTIFPVMAAAPTHIKDNTHQSVSTPSTQPNVRTTPYMLGVLESPQTVAARFGITVDELRRLNQFRTFARGFDNVRQGDELDVPLMANNLAGRNLKEMQAERDGKEPQLQVAEVAQRGGSLLSQEINSDYAEDMARGWVASSASAQASDWLSRWGTAQVSLGIDEDFSLKSSSVDFLHPWYETPNNLVFSQHTLHRTDDRTQTNHGIGWRYFASDWMSGANLFIDHDLTRYHTRTGMGIEYWRDYLKLGGNAYLRLSNWRSAPELDNDYEARPANGWDLRAEGWLPVWPQLGGKLVFEQYYGDEVALFGKDERQNDPYSITAGLSYTPVPLISFSAEQRLGKQGENDTKIGMELTLQTGHSLQKQLDPDEVAARRSLVGSRYDLVDRNNNIILEYRKKELIRLTLTDPLKGNPGEVKSLVSSLQTKYALKAYGIDAAILQSAGGEVAVSGKDIQVTIPPYRFTATPETDNAFPIAVTAEDTKGNYSRREESMVVVARPQLSLTSSMLTVDPQTLLADEKSMATLTYSARDANNHPIPGMTLKTVIKGVQDVALSEWKDNGDGTYTQVITAGKTSGSLSLMPQFNGEDVAKMPVMIGIVANGASRDTSTIETDQSNYIAGKPILVTVTLKDDKGNLVSGSKDLLNNAVMVDNTKSETSRVWIEESDGIYKGNYTADLSGDALTAQLTLPGWKTKHSDKFNIAADKTSAKISDMRVMTVNVVADTLDMHTVQVTVNDEHGNIVKQSAVSFKVTAGAALFVNGMQQITVDTDENGIAAVNLTSNEAKLNTVEAEINGISQSVDVNFNHGNAVAQNSAITLDRTEYAAGEPITVTVTLRDAQGNAVPDGAALLSGSSVTVEGADGPSGSWTGTDGTYTATWRAKTAGDDYHAALKLAGWSENKWSDAYIIRASEAVSLNSAITLDRTEYAAGEPITVTVTLRDAQGNAVPDGAALLSGSSVTVEGADGPSGSWTGTDGTYTATWRAKTAGDDYHAALKLAGWSENKWSDTYIIRASEAVSLNSAITLDRTEYAAGEPITVTVTLRDAQGNAVPDGAALLSGSSVTVEGADGPSGSWTGTDGTYTATWRAQTAGDDYHAALKLAGWSENKWSDTYIIRASEPVKINSTIRTDKTGYTVGEKIIVTVMFRDEYGNPVPGLAAKLAGSYLETYEVGGVDVPDSDGWADHNNGEYTMIWTAKFAQENLVAKLKLITWDGEITSSLYKIISGVAAYINSNIVTDATVYTAGDRVMVTINLFDEFGNAIVDGGAQLDDNSVKVNNTDTLAGENWSYVSNGKYQRNYRAHTAGGSIKAELKMSGWSESQYSNNYTINPGEASPFTSQLRIRNLWTVVDGDLIVDAYLFDAFNNPLTNHFYLLTEGSVLLQNAFPKGGGKWVYAGDGQYERIYTAQRDGTNLQSRLELPGGTVNGQPYYDILPYVRVEALRVNGKTFSSLTGFPKTGFDGAKFTLILDNNASNTDYNWKADVNWITVSSGGEVLFKSAGIPGWKATITGTPKNGRGNNVTFSVTLEKWFQSGGSALQRSWSDIKSQCSSGGHNLPDAVADLASYPSGGVVPREVGKLWGEYGDLTSYNSIFTSPDYWTNTMYEKFDPKTGMTSYAGAQSSSSLLCMEK